MSTEVKNMTHEEFDLWLAMDLLEALALVRPNAEGWWPTVPHLLAGRPWYGGIELGNGTRYKCAMFITGEKIFVGIEHYSCYTFDSLVASVYAQEKFGMGKRDAGNVCDFINYQLLALGWLSGPVPVQGEYETEFTNPVAYTAAERKAQP